MQAGLSTKNAPSIWVVAPHFVMGTLAFIVAIILLIFHREALLNYHINGPLLAITHLLILGWITPIIFGALYQLIPVIMEVKLYSEKLAYFTLGSLYTGLTMLIFSFFGFQFQSTLGFEIGGTLLIVSFLSFATNTLKSASKSSKKSINSRFIQTSVIYLLLTVLLGLFILLNLSHNLLPISHTTLLVVHATVGLAGWFLMLIIGVAAKLMPMFLIVHKTNERWLKFAFWMINAGIIMLVISAFIFSFNSYLNLSSLFLILIGLTFFLRYNMDVFSKRLRRKLDIGMKLSVTGLVFFTLSLLTFLVLFFNTNYISLPGGRLEVVFGTLLIFGFFTGLILGQTYKTLPFIIWLYHYQVLVGKAKIPMPADLYNNQLANIHFYTFIASMVSLVTGLLFSNQLLLLIGVLLMLLTALVYGANTFRMIFHKKQI